MPNKENVKVVKTTTETTIVETKETIEVRENSSEYDVHSIESLVATKIVIAGDKIKDVSIEDIIQEVCIPIRKQYRLQYNVDLVICGIPMTLPGKKKGEVTPGIAFQFMYNSVDTSDYGNSEDDMNEKFYYQKLTVRDDETSTKAGIFANRNDSRMLKMVYTDRVEYEKYRRLKSSINRNSKEEAEFNKVLIRKMNIPKRKRIWSLLKRELKEIQDELYNYLVYDLGLEDSDFSIIFYRYI